MLFIYLSCPCPQSFFQPESRERAAMVVEQFGRIAERIVQLKLGRFLHGASAIYLFSVMGLVLWGALLMQKDLSHGDNNIRPAIPVMGADPPRVSGSGMNTEAEQAPSLSPFR